jgi:hypothetical protein
VQSGNADQMFGNSDGANQVLTASANTGEWFWDLSNN